ncbi:MAG: hypothetical protein ACLP7J_13465 [Streptosporangiaceae bacterium]
MTEEAIAAMAPRIGTRAACAAAGQPSTPPELPGTPWINPAMEKEDTAQ